MCAAGRVWREGATFASAATAGHILSLPGATVSVDGVLTVAPAARPTKPTRAMSRDVRRPMLGLRQDKRSRSYKVSPTMLETDCRGSNQSIYGGPVKLAVGASLGGRASSIKGARQLHQCDQSAKIHPELAQGTKRSATRFALK